MVEEGAEDRLAGGFDLQPPQLRHHVAGDLDLGARGAQQLRRLLGHVRVAGDDRVPPEPSRSEAARVLQHQLGLAAVGPAGEEDDLGPRRLQLVELLLAQVAGEDRLNPRPRVQRRLARRGRGQVRD